MPTIAEAQNTGSLGNGTSVLKEIVIQGFWGDRTVSLDVQRDVNFLIGSNGSGKTTVINLVAAALQADISALAKYTFTTIILKFSAPRKKLSSTTVTVSKSADPNIPAQQIEYAIKVRSLPIRRYRLSTTRSSDYMYVGRVREESNIVRSPRSLRSDLRGICSVTWLSIQRTHNSKSASNETDFESPIDRKLNHLNNELVRYFSLLATRSDAEMAKFQKFVFVSLISHETESDATKLIKKLDLPREKQVLADIFKGFHVEDDEVEPLVGKHFDAVARTLKKAPFEGFDWGDVYASVAMLRVHALAEAWSSIMEACEKIDQPKTEFIGILNGLMKNKQFSINAKKELRVKLKSGNTIPIRDLSSGEKQLVIILGEALLQEKHTCIFLADEPELSLHIDWQAKLIDALRTVSPNAQILFATHSPDIVGVHQTRVVDMQDILA